MARNIPAITDVSALEAGELVYLVILRLLGETDDVLTCNFVGTNGSTFTVRPVGAGHDGFEFSTDVADNGTLTAVNAGYLSGKAMLVSGDDEGTAWVSQQRTLREISRIREEVAARAAGVGTSEPGSDESVAETKRLLDLVRDLHRLETQAHEYEQAHA